MGSLLSASTHACVRANACACVRACCLSAWYVGIQSAIDKAWVEHNVVDRTDWAEHRRVDIQGPQCLSWIAASLRAINCFYYFTYKLPPRHVVVVVVVVVHCIIIINNMSKS